MALLKLIALDLHGPAVSYDPLYEEIKKQGTWWHYMRWTWIVDSQKTADEIVDALKPHVQPTDRMIVTTLKRPYQGLLHKDEWKWINDRVDKPK